MKVVDPKHFNTTNVNITLKPAMDRELVEDFDWDRVNYLWEAISYAGGELKIQVNWNYYIEISPLSV